MDQKEHAYPQNIPPPGLLSVLLLWLAIISGIIVPENGFGQSDKSNIMNEVGARLKAHNMYTVEGFDNRYKGVKGTSTIQDQWLRGAIAYKSGNIYMSDDAAYRIDAHNEQLLVQLNGSNVFTIQCHELAFVALESEIRTDTFFAIKANQMGIDHDMSMFLQPLNDGGIRLYKYVKKDFVEADYKDPYSADRRYDEFRTEVSYFVSTDGKDFEKIKPKPKSIANALPSQRKRIKWAVETFNLNLYDETALVFLFEQLNNN